MGNGTYGDDLAVIQLTSDRPADVTNEYIQTIAMAPDNATYMTSQCVITGWGNTKGEQREKEGWGNGRGEKEEEGEEEEEGWGNARVGRRRRRRAG